ncbi:MAG: hypothetical protein KatS3mg088_123 [Patescibacteria group bacterium]|nr:MAG: hypothetical protein KatS3mg088_123 [Patescibacteria group bacterium]
MIKININKNIILVTVFFIATLLSLVGIFINKPKKEANKTEVVQKTTYQTPSLTTATEPIETNKVINTTSPKIKVSGIEVNNFYKKADIIKDDGYARFVKEKNYEIMYIPVDNSFLISITGSPFEEIRTNAEEDLLKKLGVDKTTACNLNVNITTPGHINPDFAGKVYKLSFCETK